MRRSGFYTPHTKTVKNIVSRAEISISITEGQETRMASTYVLSELKETDPKSLNQDSIEDGKLDTAGAPDG